MGIEDLRIIEKIYKGVEGEDVDRDQEMKEEEWKEGEWVRVLPHGIDSHEPVTEVGRDKVYDLTVKKPDRGRDGVFDLVITGDYAWVVDGGVREQTMFCGLNGEGNSWSGQIMFDPMDYEREAVEVKVGVYQGGEQIKTEIVRLEWRG